METSKHIGIWIRVSTDQQVKEESPEHHEQRARYYTKSKGWQVIEVYRLEAVSGKSVIEHPEAKRMLADIRSGHITGLVFSKLARLARSTKELLEFAEIFRHENADLISLAENIDTSSPAGRLFFTIIAAMAEWEREEIAARVAASVPVRAKMGKPLGGAAPFGYKWEGKDFVMDEREAPVRKLMYELFLKHQRKFAVARELHSLGYRTRNGSQFTATSIDRLLRDSTAMGQRRANYTKSTGKNKNWLIKPESEWIITPCEAIISEQLWQQCNSILDAQTKRRPVGPKAVYLLSGFVTCTCGKVMYVYQSSKTYSCAKCRTRIAVADLDEIYQVYLKDYLGSINHAEYLEQSDLQLQDCKTLLDSTTKERNKLAKKMNDLLNLRLDGEMSKESFAKEYKPLEERVAQLDAQLPQLEAEIDVRSIQLLSGDMVVNQAKTLFDEWANMAIDQKRAIVETITTNVAVGKEDITITLAYAPPLLQNPENSSHRYMAVRTFLPYTKIVSKPLKKEYPLHPQTLGEHILKQRIEKKLLQKDVAAIIGVSEDSITYWENGRSHPQIHYYPAIINFLEYYPFIHETDSLGGKLRQVRLSNGYTYQECASRFGVDTSTIKRWEKHEGRPTIQQHTLIVTLWTQLTIKSNSLFQNQNDETARKKSEFSLV